MKNIIMFCLLLFTALTQAQSFHRGALVFDLNGGFDAFNTTKTYSDVSGYDTTVFSQVANKNISGGVEVGLGKRLGIGSRGRVNSFFSNMDKVVHEKALVNTVDFLLNVNFHPIVRNHIDLLMGAEFGVSNIDMNFGSSKSFVTSGRGTYIAAYLNPRVYIGRFGINLRASLPFTEYKNLETIRESNMPNRFDLDYWKGIGIGFSVGVQVRLF